MSEEIKQLSTEQLQDLVEFANQISGVFSPYMSNALWKRTAGSKYNASLSDVQKALESGDERLLREYSNFQKSYSSLFSKLIKQYTSYVKFNVVPTCVNATFDDYNSPEFALEKQKMYQWLDAFPYRQEFPAILERLFTQEYAVLSIRKRRAKWIIEELPIDYCILVGKSEFGYLAAFDMTWFSQSGVDIRSYNPFFIEALNNPDKYKYTPSASQSRFRGHYANWVALPPSSGFHIIKLQPGNFDNIPIFASALKDIVQEDTLREIQMNKNLISAYAILAGEIGTIENGKVQKPDFTRFNPRTLGSFLSRARQGLDESVKLLALPLENQRLLQYDDSNPEMVIKSEDAAASSASFVGSVILDSDKQNIKTISLAQTALESIAESVRPQFENIMNQVCNQITRKFKWTFNFVGSKNAEIEKSRVDNYFRLMDKGIVLPPAYFASVIDVPPQVFERSLEESKAMNWIEQFSQVAKSIYTQTTDTSTGERSLKPDTEIADESIQSREARGIDSATRTITQS